MKMREIIPYNEKVGIIWNKDKRKNVKKQTKSIK